MFILGRLVPIPVVFTRMISLQQTTNSTAKKKTSSNNVTATSGKFTNEQSTTATSNNMSNLGDPANTALGTNNHHNMKQFLGQFSIEDSSNPIPGFPLLDLTSVNNGSTSSTEEIVHLGQVFEDLYKQHASILVQTVFELNFSRYVCSNYLIFFRRIKLISNIA